VKHWKLIAHWYGGLSKEEKEEEELEEQDEEEELE
jgi:hypothetical protein